MGFERPLIHGPDDMARLRSVVLSGKGAGLAERPISEVVTLNGARGTLDNGSWALARASSDAPSLVVVCETTESPKDLKDIFRGTEAMIRQEPEVGDFDQTI